MDKWITIKTFTLPTEVVVLRGRLEAEGIECFVQNELTAQVNPFYSNAIGGVQLQVKESDLQNAIAILKEGGYLADEKTESPNFLIKLDSLTSKIPFLKRVPLTIRLMILVAVMVGVALSIFVYATLPTPYEKLTSTNWCLDYVVYDHKNFIPQTVNSLKLVGPGFCDESISFMKNGSVMLPGFGSSFVLGQWQLENNLLQISDADTFDFVYNGTYRVDFSNDKLLLESDKTSLNCHTENIRANLRP